MAAIFGHRWTSQHDGEREAVMAMMTWREGLDGIEDEEIKLGIAQCMRDGGEWPPSLPVFRSMCIATRARSSPEPPAYLEHQPGPGDGSGYQEFRTALGNLKSKMLTKEAGGEA